MGKKISFDVVIQHSVKRRFVEKQLDLVATFYLDETNAAAEHQQVKKLFLLNALGTIIEMKTY